MALLYSGMGPWSLVELSMAFFMMLRGVVVVWCSVDDGGLVWLMVV